MSIEKTLSEVFVENGQQEFVFLENIDGLCKNSTVLTEADIKILHNFTKEIINCAYEQKQDVFINCILYPNTDPVTVAGVYTKNTMYAFPTIGDVVHEEDEPAVLRTFRYGKDSDDIIAKSFTTTEGHRLIQCVSPIFNEDKIIGVIVRERPVSDIEMVIWGKKEYHEPDFERYPYLVNLTSLAECTTDAVIILNKEKKVVYRNDLAQELYQKYGYIQDIYEKNYEKISFHGDIAVGSGYANSKKQCLLNCAGKNLRIQEFCYLFNEYYYIIVMQDITQEKQKEADLISKTVAIREAHHRIKNNMQTVYNILDMQRRRLKNEDSQKALTEAMSRISSIASSYQILSQKGNDEVDILDLLQLLAAKVVSLVDSEDLKVEIKVKGQSSYVTADNATDIAIVVNELLQNSIKHAFDNMQNGRIEIAVVNKPLYSEIIVSDNGNGFDRTLMHKAAGGLGHQISETIVKTKLKGEIEYITGFTGTTVIFTFKCLEK